MFRGCWVSTASQTKPFWSIDWSSLKNRRSSDRVREKVLDWSSVRDGMNRERCFGTIENKKAFWSWVDSKVGPFMIKFEAKKFARKNLNEAKNKNKNEIRHFKFPAKNSGFFFLNSFRWWFSLPLSRLFCLSDVVGFFDCFVWIWLPSVDPNWGSEAAFSDGDLNY